MRLRTLILLFLIILGLAPVASVVSLNLPMVLANLELWVQRAHLQNLRVEFGDLDRYLASREEMVRFLAKQVPPDLPSGGDAPGATVAGVPFDEWIQQTLRAGPEVFEVIYLDRSGREHYRLKRDEVGAPLKAVRPDRDADHRLYFEIGMSMQADGVFFAPIELPDQAIDANHPLIIRLVSPVFGGEIESVGVVLANVDAGGMAYAYGDLLWVLNDGRYLPNPTSAQFEGNARIDFPGFDELVLQPAVGMLRGRDDRQVVWMPLMPTQQGGSLWVGKFVDPTDMDAFRTRLVRRVLVIVFVLIVVVFLLARWIALRTERFGAELQEGVRRALDHESAVRFSWRGPRELQDLARGLSRLADSHARATRKLVDRAAELEASNRYKSEFLANMSHELRTPLNSITLLSKLLAANDGGNLTPEQVRQARVVHKAGTELAHMINDILDLSKIEARRTSFYLDHIAIRDLCGSVAGMFEPQAEARGLRLDQVVEDDAPERVFSDADKLRQILRNFLSNAVKFTRDGGITLTLGRNHGPDAQDRPLAITVADTGIGIPAEQQQTVFEPFRQADGSTSRRYGGTGLGLTISNETAKLLGGRIGLESEVGRGSAFTLYLPLEMDTSGLDPELYTIHREGEDSTPAVAPVEPPPAADTPAAEPPRGVDPLTGRRVLIVDDNLDHLLHLTPLLEGWGMNVTAAGSLQEALHTLGDEAPFDAILLDALMSGYGKATAWQELHRHPQRGDTPMLPLAEADVPADLPPGTLRLPVAEKRLREALAALLQVAEPI